MRRVLRTPGGLNGAGMLHLRELQVLLCACVVERDREVVGNWLIAKTAFPSLNAMCPST